MKRAIAPIGTVIGKPLWLLVLLGTLLAASMLFWWSSVAAQGVAIEMVDASLGNAVYAANCAACHQATGMGIRSAVPPLAATVPDLLSVAGGRAYLVAIVLYGASGPLSVNGATYDGLMPSWHHLSDDQVAGLLNYVATGWRNHEQLPAGVEAFTPLQVALARADVKTAAEVLKMRPSTER